MVEKKEEKPLSGKSSSSSGKTSPETRKPTSDDPTSIASLEEEEKEDSLSEPKEKGAEMQGIEAAVKNAGIFLSPEAIIMLSLAGFIDIAELLLELIPTVGNVLSIIVDIFAVFFFGFWMWLRSGVINVPKKTGERIAKATKKMTQWSKKLKWLRPLCFLIELLPIGSSVLPLWFLVVFLELKHNTY